MPHVDVQDYSNTLLMIYRLGTFYNATPGSLRKQKVKEWAWEAYPEIYEDLLKLGQYEVVKGDPEDEDSFVERETFFDIGPIGRDVRA